MDLSPQKPPVAVLVDGENLSFTHAQAILTNARRYGDPMIRRVYGKPEAIAAWADHGFRLITTRPGKNAADLLLSVEAMTLALKDNIKTLIVASSDSDFSYLANQLRECGHRLIGMGEGKTPGAFRAACTEFTHLDVAQPQPPPPPKATKDTKDLTEWVVSRLAVSGADGVAITLLNTEASRAGFQISQT
ncbi:NYN domain-containing protein, partial [Pseudotabrizicola sp.]|uniref:NYN domain-containing protein n=1 Tax=Pseudotabrizicola sp. TaxID=2939647 RepID=UPI00271FB15B